MISTGGASMAAVARTAGGAGVGRGGWDAGRDRSPDTPFSQAFTGFAMGGDRVNTDSLKSASMTMGG